MLDRRSNAKILPGEKLYVVGTNFYWVEEARFASRLIKLSREKSAFEAHLANDVSERTGSSFRKGSVKHSGTFNWNAGSKKGHESFPRHLRDEGKRSGIRFNRAGTLYARVCHPQKCGRTVEVPRTCWILSNVRKQRDSVVVVLDSFAPGGGIL